MDAASKGRSRRDALHKRREGDQPRDGQCPAGDGRAKADARPYLCRQELPSSKRWLSIREQGRAAAAAAGRVLQGVRASDSWRERSRASAHRDGARRGNLLHAGPLRHVYSSESVDGAEMAIKTGTFEYTDSQDSMCEQDDFVLRVPGGIRSKAELLAALASAGRFPDYFGGNWDALQDCLRDLSWISNRKVVIMHSDLPLHDSPAECRTYLEIL